MAPLSRRSALSLAAGTAVAAAVIPTIAGSEQARADSRLPVRSDYSGRVGTVFTARTEAGSLALTLDAVTDLAGSTPGDEHAFSLEFVSTQSVPSQTYLLTASGVPDAVLFLSPIGATRSQVVVNRRS